MSATAVNRSRGPKSTKRIGNLRLNDVQIVLAEARSHVRTGLKGALAESGLHNIIDAGQVKSLAEAVSQALGPDIVICDAGLGGEGDGDGNGNVCDIIRGLRNNEIGRNPFVCIIAITWNPTDAEVDKIIESGVDTLLAAPFSPQQVLDRVDTLVHHRMPFVVTSDYIGPDRRSGSDRASTIPLIDAPNTLRAKALGEWNLAEMRESISGTIGNIKFRKIERHAVDIASIAERVVVQSTMPGPDMSRTNLARLRELITELDERAREQNMMYLCELCASAGNLVAKMYDTRDGQNEKDLQLLHHLSLAIRAGAQSDTHGETALAHDIAQTVNNADRSLF